MLSFVVLCGFDIGYEVFYQVLGKNCGVSSFVNKKMYTGAAFILLGLFVLKLHEYLVLCSGAWVDELDATGGRALHSSDMCTFFSLNVNKRSFWYAGHFGKSA